MFIFKANFSDFGFSRAWSPDVFLELDHYFFLDFGMVLETYMKFCVTGLNFLKWFYLSQKLWKQPKNRVFLNWVCNKSLYYLLYCCTNHIFRKSLVSDKWSKILLASHIEKYLSGRGQKWTWPIRPWGSQICCIS